jgi:hypothetical protein
MASDEVISENSEDEVDEENEETRRIRESCKRTWLGDYH